MQKAAADPLIGHLLEGRYRIGAFLAVGGMSTVYAGVDERLDREVAVKVMAPTLSADPVFVDRFAREARSAARLSHVNAVAVYDQGRDGNRVFLVMELVRGRTLRDLLRERGHLSPAEAVSLMEPILAALAAAHRAGLVHRDVKPENILLSDDGVVKVADFGLARAVEGDPGAANTGMIMGTVAYSAPEQFRRGKTDMHSDVYSAGIVLFELLTGRQPHVGPDSMTVAYNHVHRDVPPPSAFQAGIAPELDEVVRRATARDARIRPQDAGAFLAQLDDVRQTLRLPVLPVPRRPRADGRAGPGGATGGDRSAERRAGATAIQPETLSRPAARDEYDRSGREPPHRDRSQRDATAVQSPGGTGVRGSDAIPNGNSPTTVQGRTGTGRSDVQHTLVEPQLAPAGPPFGASAGPTSTFGPPHPDGSGYRSAPARPKRRRPWLRTLVGALVLLLVCAGLVAGSWYYAAGRWGSIPNVVNQPLQRATQALKAEGYQVAVDRTQANDAVGKGNVVATVPDVGSRLVHGRTVHVVVSAGPTLYRVPALGGQPRSAAATALRTFGGHGVTVTYSETSDDHVPAGAVVRSNPPGGSTVRRGGTITVYVSTGPPIVALPDVTTQPVDVAMATLTGLQFKVSRTDVFSDDVVAGVVIRQAPAGPTQQRKFSVVTLEVSKGPDLVTVPEVPRLDPLSDAENRITAAGLQWTVRTSFGGIAGLVIRIAPAAGQQVKRGSTVTLTII